MTRETPVLRIGGEKERAWMASLGRVLFGAVGQTRPEKVWPLARRDDQDGWEKSDQSILRLGYFTKYWINFG